MEHYLQLRVNKLPFVLLLTTPIFLQQQFDDAFKHYSEALQLNPDHILSQFGVGQLHLKRGL